MSQDDVLFGYRLQLFDLAGRGSVSHACHTFGIHRSTYYRWKAKFGGMEVSDARRLKQLEDENRRLKRIVAELKGGASQAGGK